MTKLCTPTVSKYMRGLVLSYMMSRKFGCAYLTSQAYMKAFADAVVEHSPFFYKLSDGEGECDVVILQNQTRAHIDQEESGSGFHQQ